MQRFLIIGSNSFSGSHFCNFLANKGIEVLATSRSDEPHNSFLPYKWMSKNKNLISFHRLDLNHDLEIYCCLGLFAGAWVDGVWKVMQECGKAWAWGGSRALFI